MPGASSIDHLFKLTIVGEECTGKSALLTSYVENRFLQEYSMTIGVQFMNKTITIDDKRCKLQLWDCGGEPRFREVTKSYYRGNYGCFLVFDITSRASFLGLRYWIEDIASWKPHMPGILVGNKCDLETDREVSILEAQELAARCGIPYFETSAKTGQNVSEIFLTLGSRVLHEISSTLREDIIFPATSTIRNYNTDREMLHSQDSTIADYEQMTVQDLAAP